jgi:hypothetical protein
VLHKGPLESKDLPDLLFGYVPVCCRNDHLAFPRAHCDTSQFGTLSRKPVPDWPCCLQRRAQLHYFARRRAQDAVVRPAVGRKGSAVFVSREPLLAMAAAAQAAQLPRRIIKV